MAATKRTPHEIEHHRREIARLYLQRQPQEAIAKRLKISRNMVAYDLGEVQKRWRAECIVDIDQRKAEELQRIDAVEREYWRAWEASHDPWDEDGQPEPEAYDGELALRRAQKAVGKRGGSSGRRTGFAGYLEGVERCIEMRCRILGIPTPAERGQGQGGNTIIVFENTVPGLSAGEDARAVGPQAGVLGQLLEGEWSDGNDGSQSSAGSAPDLSPAAEPETG